MSEQGENPSRTIGGRYVLGPSIGEGGMGQVFRARDTRLAREVAIKLLHPELGRKTGAGQRFLREAQIGAQLSHEHLVQTYDFGKDGDNLFLAMELLHGRNLAIYLRERGTLEQSEVLAVARQIASGLALAHCKDLVHRDLKPDNIVLVSEVPLTCKVIDFGMAVQSSEHTGEAMARLTIDGSIGGTPRYMAPEQLRGAAPVAASDVYALGCVLFELAIGAPPYDLDALGEVAAHHLYAPIPDLHSLRPALSPVLCELVRRCLGKTPSSRPTMEQVLGRLDEISSPVPRRRHNRRSTLPSCSERALYASDQTPTESMSSPPPASALGHAGIIAIRGPATTELRLAVGAAGFSIEDESVASAIVCFEHSSSEIEALCRDHKLVIADANPGDMTRVAQLLRLGVAEVLPKPVMADKLVAQLRRAIRIHNRSTRG